MAEKVFVNSNMVGTIACPQCKKHWEKDLSKFKNLSNINGIKCKCPCGYSFPIELERRKHFRKQTNLTGSYLHDKSKIRGLITIKNISKSGVGLELNTKQFFPKGGKLVLKFNLNDEKRSYICKEAIVKKTDGTSVGLEFIDIENDENLELYLKK